MAPGEMFSLHGRVALITGASRGLGFEIAKALARAGARVVINGSNPERAEAAAAALTADGLDAFALAFDVRDEAVAGAALDQLAASEGRLDILVNNVGTRLRAPIDEMTTDAFRELLDIDLVAPFALSTRAAKIMRAGGYGRIIMMASIQGLLGRTGDAAYISAKGGMLALTRALAAEYGPDGITCNALVPGSFATETNQEMANSDAGRKLAQRRAFLRRWGEPHEVAGAAVFLASEAASYVTGASIVVDGGWSASSL